MDWKSLAARVSTAAPLLGTLIGGPAGGAAGTAVKMIAGALGVRETPEAIEAELLANPDAYLKLKELELANKVELQRLALEHERLAFEHERARLADVADARDRQIRHERATGKKDTNLYILAWTVVIGFFGLMALLCFHALPAGSSDVIFMLFGALATGFGQVLQYFFGSSQSSVDKTYLMANSKGRA